MIVVCEIYGEIWIICRKVIIKRESMNLNPSVSALQNMQNLKSASSPNTRVGARINARVASDLGGGRYILNLGGNETLYVESETSFRENEQVKVELQQTENGRVELRLISRDSEQTAALTGVSADSATLNRELQFSLPTESLNDVFSVVHTVSRNSGQEREMQDPAVNMSVELSESVGMQDGGAVSSQGTVEIQLLVGRNPETGEINSVKVVLPDGKAIAAELIVGESVESSVVVESRGEEDGGEPSLREAVFGESSGKSADKSIASDEVVAEKQSGLKDLLIGIADRFFSRQGVAAPSSAAQRTATAALLLTEMSLPLQLSSEVLTSVGQELPLPAMDIALPVMPGSDLLREILAASELALLRTAEGGYALSLTADSGEVREIALPREIMAQLPVEAESLLTPGGSLPLELGARSLLQGVIQENLSTVGDASTFQLSPDTLRKPQEDTTRLDRLIEKNGMTPSTATREAATALLNNDLPVSRDNIQSLLALSAGHSGEERAAFLNAGARLISLDAPLSPALAAGMSRLLAEPSSMSGALERIGAALDNASSAVLADSGIGDSTSAAQLAENHDALAALLRRAVTTLRGIPVLLETLGLNSGGEGEAVPTWTPTAEIAQELQDFVSTSARERLATIENLLHNSASRILQQDPVLERLSPVLDAVLARLGNLPDETLEVVKPVVESPLPPEGGSPADSIGSKEMNLSRLKDILPPDFSNQPGRELQLNLSNLLKDIPLFGERLAHPGISSIPEFWERVEVDSITLQKADLPVLKEGIERILNAPSAQKAEELTRELLRSVDKDTLRTLAGTLQEIEREEIQKHPALNSLREASHELRELGRALVAQKAENLAQSRNDPASFNTSIPFTFNDSSGNGDEGKLSMFYNRSKGRKGDWQQRVILDLNMSVLGNIIGDIQFLDGMINVNLVSSERDTVAILEGEKDELSGGLENLGFEVSIGVRLLEPEKIRERERNSDSTSTHILDIQA